MVSRAPNQRIDHVTQAALRLLAAVLNHLQLGTFGQGLADLRDPLAHLVGHGHRARVTRTSHRDADIGVPVAQAETGEFGEAVGDGRHLAETHDLVATPFDHDFLEFVRRLDAPDQADAFLVELALDAPDRRRRVLPAQGVDHVVERDVVLAQLLGAQQD